MLRDSAPSDRRSLRTSCESWIDSSLVKNKLGHFTGLGEMSKHELTQRSRNAVARFQTIFNLVQASCSRCLRYVEGNVFTVVSTAVVVLNVAVLVKEMTDERSLGPSSA